MACAIRAGDIMLIVKGSLGSRMKTIVNALQKRFPGNTRATKPRYRAD
jgi:UDP-N-acetylmuramoyl-tripeptide--D-alanyl-D-alanine ligase